ncbi:MAG: AMP-binding protein, partial [Pseudomonadota bacterium]
MTSDVTGRPVSETHQEPEFPWIKSYPPQVDWHQAFSSKPLHHLIQEAAAKFPKNVCTDFLGRQTTYQEINQAVHQIAVGLQQLGVKKGTKVGLFLPNSPTFIIYYYAILQAGGIVVNYNPLYTVEELSYQVKDSETELMVTLDLKVLFEKVEALLANGVLNQAVIASFTALLPPTKAALFKIFKSGELARPLASEQTANITLESGLDSEPEFETVDID